MATSRPQGQPPTNDKAMEAMFAGIAVIVAIVIFWLHSHTAISQFVMHVRQVESYLIPFDPGAQHAIRVWLATTPADQVTIDQLQQSGALAGRILSWVVVAILAGLAGFLVWRSPERGGRYNRTYTMESLARQESSLWPYAVPVFDAQLLDVPLDDPVQGMRQTPRAYAKRLKFVVPTFALKELPEDAEPVSATETLLTARARQVFAKQLGRRWQGIDKLQPHEKALFAAFAAQACYANEAALELINELPYAYLKAVRSKDASLITSRLVEPLLTAHGNSEVVKKILARHTYVRTVLMALLLAARKNGVMPPNWFRWLKTVDRITWYALADLGTENASVEAAGVRCHFNAERLIRGAVDQPEVEAAVDGLREYLQEYLDEEDDDA